MTTKEKIELIRDELDKMGLKREQELIRLAYMTRSRTEKARLYREINLSLKAERAIRTILNAILENMENEKINRLLYGSDLETTLEEITTADLEGL